MIFYLNGTSSSGKSSVAIELQELIKSPVFYFSIDTLLYSLSPPILDSIQGKRAGAIAINWNSIFLGYFECIASLHRTGNSVIADCPVYSDELQKNFTTTLGPLTEKFVVGIHCPIEILRKREIDRGDRAVGLVDRQFPTIHSRLNYDLTVDSGIRSPKEIAQRILRHAKKIE